MGGMNKVILIGRLGKDPELTYLQSGDAVCNMSLATSDKWNDKNTGEKKEKTEWHRLKAFKDKATLCGQWLKKGQEVGFVGKLQTSEWKDKDGNKRFTTEVVVNEIVFIGSGRGSQDPKPESAIDQYKREVGKENGFLPESNLPTSDDDAPF